METSFNTAAYRFITFDVHFFYIFRGKQTAAAAAAYLNAFGNFCLKLDYSD